MRRNITMLILFLSVFILCGVAAAGPIDNARQFQQKEVKTAIRSQSPSSLAEKPGPAIDTVSGESVVNPAEEQPVEEEKIKIEISDKEIESRVPSYKTDLKDIIREADASIKKIDDALKAEEAEKSAKEHYDKGSAFYNEGKFEEAGKEWNTALGLAKESEFRKCIRASLKRSARQIRQAKEKREAEEWAKKKEECNKKRCARR
jgi:hypothetical protein